MKFTVARDVFSEAVSWTARAVPVRPASPILSGVRITAQQDVLTLSSFDYEVSANSEVPATVEEAGEVLVSGRLLADISKALPQHPVTLTLDGQKVEITCGKSRFSLAVMSVEEYPTLPAQPETKGSIDSHVLSQAIGQVSVAASRDEALPLLTGVRMEIEEDTITLLATDRYRLAVRELQWEPTDSSYTTEVLAKAKILQDVAKSMTTGSKMDLGFGGTSQATGTSLVGFEVAGRRMTSTLMDGDYPAVRRLLPTETPITALVHRQSLLETAKRVALVAERKTSIRLSFSAGQVVLEAGQGENAQASETLEATLNGESIATAFNPQYLIDGLNVIEGDYVRFGFVHSTKPVVLVGQEKEDSDPLMNFQYLLMPIRFGV